MLLRITFKPVSFFSTLPKANTFFGAFCHGIKLLFGEQVLKNFLQAYKDAPPVLFSTCLFIKEDRLYFPKPQLPYGDIFRNGNQENTDKIKQYKNFKDIKKTKYVPQELFQKVINSEVSNYEELFQNENLEKIEIAQEIMPYASINRLTNTTTGGEFYNQKIYALPHFACLVKVNENLDLEVGDLKEFFKRIFELVGLGGNRNVGMGWSKVEVIEETGWLKESVEKKTDTFISLSETFYDESFRLEESLYDVEVMRPAIERGYGINVPVVWKRKLMLLSAGSKIKVNQSKNFYGSLKEVVNYKGFSIYHYGVAFPLYIKGGKDVQKNTL